jgi:hypothetical protein
MKGVAVGMIMAEMAMCKKYEMMCRVLERGKKCEMTSVAVEVIMAEMVMCKQYKMM